MHRKARFLVSALSAAALLAGCPMDESSPSSASAPDANALMAPAPPPFPGADAFVAEIDNPYLGFARGRIFTYEEETDQGLETNIVEVTQDSKEILGVSTTVVHDQVFLNG